MTIDLKDLQAKQQGAILPMNKTERKQVAERVQKEHDIAPQNIPIMSWQALAEQARDHSAELLTALAAAEREVDRLREGMREIGRAHV